MTAAFVCVAAMTCCGCSRPKANPVEPTEHEFLVTDANYASTVASSDIPVLLDFSAEWCPPCQDMAPIVRRVAEDYEGRVAVGLVDTDDPDTASVAEAYRVHSMPVFFIVKAGEPVASVSGKVPEAEFRKWIDQFTGE